MEIIKKADLNHITYKNIVKNRNFDSSFAELTECLTCVQKWKDGVKLKLNPEKT